MYWTLELASKLEDAPWPATKDELIDYAMRSGAPLEVVENLQEIEDEGEIYECIEDISAKEICDQFSYKEISKSTYEELKETGLMGMGLPMIIEKAIEDLGYEEDYEEDDE